MTCQPASSTAAWGDGTSGGDGETSVDGSFAVLTATKQAEDREFDPSMLSSRSLSTGAAHLVGLLGGRWWGRCRTFQEYGVGKPERLDSRR